MNLYDLNNDNTIINIDGKDIEMKQPICYGKIYDKWLVSKCGKVWGVTSNRLLKGTIVYNYKKEGKRISAVKLTIHAPIGFWEDGSGNNSGGRARTTIERTIKYHKIILDTWAPLYDNPPEGIVWEEWEIVRDLPSVYNYISKSIWVDHIDDNPQNNHIDNLRRVTTWDNQATRKSKGI